MLVTADLAPADDKYAFDHLLRADYCINNASMAGGVCPATAQGWSQWWQLGWFKDYVLKKAKAEGGEQPLDFYRKYIDGSIDVQERLALQFSQGARFALSRDVIHSRPKEDYEVRPQWSFTPSPPSPSHPALWSSCGCPGAPRFPCALGRPILWLLHGMDVVRPFSWWASLS